MATAAQLAEAVSLEMTGYWRPTMRSYLGRVLKARILERRDGLGLSIPVRALDEVLSETPNMLVIDVEGFEPAVIAGAKRLLADPKLEIIIVETLGLASDYNLDDRAMHDTILTTGFVRAKYAGFTRVLEPTMGMDKFNTIYVRHVARVSEKAAK